MPLLLVLAWLLPVAMLAWLAVVIAPEHSGSRAGLLAVAVLGRFLICFRPVLLLALRLH